MTKFGDKQDVRTSASLHHSTFSLLLPLSPISLSLSPPPLPSVLFRRSRPNLTWPHSMEIPTASTPHIRSWQLQSLPPSLLPRLVPSRGDLPHHRATEKRTGGPYEPLSTSATPREGGLPAVRSSESVPSESVCSDAIWSAGDCGSRESQEQLPT